MSIRLLIVDDQALFRQGLRTLFETEPDVRIVGEAVDGLDALAVLDEVAVDVALVDARMPRMDGLTLITEMSSRHPAVACVLLTTFDEEENVVGAYRAGARGHLLKDAEPDELVGSIRRAHAGQVVVGEAAGAHLVSRLRDGPTAHAMFDGAERLTARELDVARAVAAGNSNREIAQRLNITEGTVKNHVSSVLRRLDLADRTQLAVRVTQG